MASNQRDRRKRNPNVECSVENEAPDGGWGWFCVLGCAIGHMILGGLGRASGIQFLILQDKFGRSASLTAWVLSIGDTLLLVSSPISSAICNRFTCRLTVISGSILTAAAFVLTFLVPKFEFLFFSLGILSGIGRSLSYTPSVIIVGLYFNKRRSLATGLATAGTGIGGLFMPPLLDLLYREYGFAGAMLIIGGLVLNIAIAGSLFRPLDVNKKITAFARNRRLRKRCSTNDMELKPLETNADHVAQSGVINENLMLKITSVDTISTDKDDNNKHKITSVDTISTDKDDNHTLMEDTERVAKDQSVNVKHVEEYAESMSSSDKTNEHHSQPKTKFFEISLLRNPSFLLVCLSSFCVMVALKSSLVFIPALAKQNGVSDIKAALILSIMGGADFLSRFMAGILDHKRIRKYRLWICNMVLAICSVLTVLFTVVTNFAGFAILAPFVAFTLGLYMSQISVIIVDILGVGKLMTSFGLINVFRGLGMLIGPPIAGLFRDMIGSFTDAYYFSGALFFLSALLMLASNVIHARSRKARTES